MPVFIVTHHTRAPLRMEGGTTFYFVTDGIHAALEQARRAANGIDVRIGGAPNLIQQYLREGLVDDIHLAISPILLGSGSRLLDGVDLHSLGYSCIEHAVSPKVTHIVLARQHLQGKP